MTRRLTEKQFRMIDRIRRGVPPLIGVRLHAGAKTFNALQGMGAVDQDGRITPLGKMLLEHELALERARERRRAEKQRRGIA